MITVIKKIYSILSGWTTYNEIQVHKEVAKIIAVKCQKGNTNLSESPEKWAENKINAHRDFEIFTDENTKYKFEF